MTVVLLHGLGADRAQPLRLFGPLFGPEELVIAPDVRAHGGSNRLGPASAFALDELADEVAAEVLAALPRTGPDAETSTPLSIIGISMGAAIALRIALRALLPIGRAVFVRPAFTSVALPHNLEAFPLIGQLLHDLGSDAGAAAFTNTRAYRAVLAESPLGAAGLMTQFTAPDARARAIRLMEIPRNRAYANPSELASLADRGVPSLVIGTPRDPAHPLGVAEEWAGGLESPLEIAPARDDGQAAQNDAIRRRVGDWLAVTPRA